MGKKGEIYTQIVTAICLALSMLFIYTAVSKMVNLETFRFRLEKMPYIKTYASSLYLLVPISELVIAALLFFNKYRLLALYASLTLLFFFTAYISVVLNFSDSIPCSCGGVISSLGWTGHILFNILFMAFSIWAILLSKQKHKTKNL